MNKELADEYLKTLASAYVWVASADQGADNVELRKYEHVMVESQFATQFEADNIRRYFKDMVTMFIDDFDAGIALTRTRLEKIRGQGHLTEEVIRVCRAAIVADGDIDEAEENALTEISKALGL